MLTWRRFSVGVLVFMGLALIFSLFNANVVEAAPTFANPNFQQVWQYSDKAVDEIPNAGRGYTWGFNSFTIKQETYQEAPNGTRAVQYFDKSRMELGADGKSVTNGLLTKELVSGKRQDGDNTFTQLTPSQTQVAGDDNSNGNNSIAPTYASFQNVVSLVPGQNRTDPNESGSIVSFSIDHNGKPAALPPDTILMANGNAITITYYEPVLGHHIPRAFTEFMQLQGQVWNGTGYTLGKVYTDNPTANVFGYPISEPYWTQAVVAGKTQWLVVQLFERRVLTYTPSNPVGFRVEMGNIGQHYYQWRYTSQSNPNTGRFPTDFSQYATAYNHPNGTQPQGNVGYIDKLNWQPKTVVSPEWVQFASPAISADGGLVIYNTSLGIAAMDTNTLQNRWHFDVGPVGEGSLSVPFIYNGVVYVGYADHIFALDLNDGTVKWDFPLQQLESDDPVGLKSQNSTFITDGTNLYFSANGGDPSLGMLVALRLSDGTMIWKVKETSKSFGDPIFGSSGNIYLTANYYQISSGTIEGFTPQGTPLTTWNAPTLGTFSGNTRLAYANNKFYAGTEQGILYILDSTSGTILAQWSLRGAVTTVPAVVGDNIYVGTTVTNGRGGDFYILSINNPQQIKFFRKFGLATASSPVVADGYVYFAGDEDYRNWFSSRSVPSTLYRLNIADFSDLKVLIDSHANYLENNFYSNSPLIYKGKIYISSRFGLVVIS
jgi:outer membrane protein assembly factor BamB